MLHCDVNGVESLRPRRVYQWLKNDVQIDGESTPTLQFSPLNLSDAGRYTCRVITTAEKVAFNRTNTATYVISLNSKQMKLCLWLCLII